MRNRLTLMGARDIGMQRRRVVPGALIGTLTKNAVASTGLALAMVCLACGGDKEPAKSPTDARIIRPTAVVLEKCPVDGEGTEKFDADADGRPEIVVHRAGGRETCRVSDLNFDGRPDVTTYFDESSHVRRTESDFDRDGRVDEIAIFSGGTLTERDRATTLSGKLDTWEFYSEGKIARAERDENGDGVVDQWWEYSHPDCPLIHSDTDGDGRPDPAASIDYCKVTGYVPPPPQESRPTSPNFESQTPAMAPVRELSNVSTSEAAGAKESTKAATPAGGDE